MQPASTLDRRAEREATLRLLQELSPGSRLVRTQRFRGGLGSLMQRLVNEEPAGTRSSVVLRRYVQGSLSMMPEDAAREFRVLKLLDSVGVPAPKPLLLDAEGSFFDTPAMVLSYIPGRSEMVPAERPREDSRHIDRWTDDLARGLTTLQSVTPARFDLSWLPTLMADGVREEAEELRARVAGMEPLARVAFGAIEALLPHVEWLEPCLVHHDFWPGNTVWFRRRLVAVIDWSFARVGDPRPDVSQCRADLIVSHSIELADDFLTAYERRVGRPMPNMRFFDLLKGLRALVHYQSWLRGYHDAGMTHLQPEAVGERLRAFLRQKLASV